MKLTKLNINIVSAVQKFVQAIPAALTTFLTWIVQ